MIRIPYITFIGDNSVKTYEWLDLMKVFDEWEAATWAVFQLEKSRTGYLHWQICIRVMGTINTNTVRSILYQTKKRVNIYVRMCNDVAKSIAYCQKVETRELGPFKWEKGQDTARIFQNPRSCICGVCIRCTMVSLNAPENS